MACGHREEFFGGSKVTAISPQLGPSVHLLPPSPSVENPCHCMALTTLSQLNGPWSNCRQPQPCFFSAATPNHQTRSRKHQVLLSAF